jgi:hypothetical protein
LTKVIRLLWVAAPVALIALALTGCAPDTSAPELQPREVAQVPSGEDAEPTPTPTISVEELALTAEAVALANAGCLQCHTDEEQLRALAVEEEVESLSEGPG